MAALRTAARQLDRYAEAGNCSDDRYAGRSTPTGTIPRNRCLSSAELNVRIHSAPAPSLLRTDSAAGSEGGVGRVPRSGVGPHRRWSELGEGQDEILQAPYVLVGTVDQMVQDLQARRERWRISYCSIHEPYLDAFAPVVAQLTGK